MKLTEFRMNSQLAVRVLCWDKFILILDASLIFRMQVLLRTHDATPPHLDVFCVWEAQSICLVSVVLLQRVAQSFVCGVGFLRLF